MNNFTIIHWICPGKIDGWTQTCSHKTFSLALWLLYKTSSKHTSDVIMQELKIAGGLIYNSKHRVSVSNGNMKNNLNQKTAIAFGKECTYFLLNPIHTKWDHLRPSRLGFCVKSKPLTFMQNSRSLLEIHLAIRWCKWLCRLDDRFCSCYEKLSKTTTIIFLNSTLHRTLLGQERKWLHLV